MADVVAAGEPDPGVGVGDEVHDAVHDLVQQRLHLLVTSLAGSGNGHQRGVTGLPVRLLQHHGGQRHDLREHGLAAEAAGEPVEGGLGHHGVALDVLLLMLVTDGPVVLVHQQQPLMPQQQHQHIL